MNRLSYVLLLSVFNAASLMAQRPLNPRYLAEFPTAERILLDIRANDPQETAARQMGALFQMNRILGELSEGRDLRNQLTYDEQSLMTSYRLHRSEIQQSLADKTFRAMRGYEQDAKFRDELLKRYFSPALQAQWAKVTSEYNARIQGGGNVPVTGVPPPAAAAPPAAAPSKQAANAVGPPDPSIAKARASNVDTKVFGIPLGEPLALPKCNLFGGLFGGQPQPNCIADADPTGLIAGLIGDIGDIVPGGDNVQTLQLADGNCPTWLDGCEFFAIMRNGRFVAARLRTKGRTVETAVSKELRGKYGERASMQQRFITPDNGSKEFQVWDLDWEFPGLHVEYKVVDATVNDGAVLIESESIYNQRKAQIKEAAKPKL